MDKEPFESYYMETAPWDIPDPQPAVVGLEDSGAIRGSVLDCGCGTGENALFLASRGYEVWGVDFVPVAIERATAKARERGLDVHFQVGDALKLDQLGRSFDTAIDCGLFHTFSDQERTIYVAGLAVAVRPGGRVHVLCFSEQEPPGQGPRRVTQEEIRGAFRDGWEVESIREARFQATDHPEARTFSPGGPKAWLATIQRTDA
jgi:SAM-dependent methyltransferase